jgi:uncharacterized protein (TIGR00251 family)
MKINVRVVPGSSRREVKIENNDLKVYLTRPAVDGEANIQLIEVLAGHFKVKKYNIEIVRGHRSRNKVIRIEDARASRLEK